MYFAGVGNADSPLQTRFALPPKPHLTDGWKPP